MPLGRGIGEMWEAVRDRVEVSGHHPVWRITAGSFDSALDYARRRFGEPVVLDRRDRTRWWPRVMLTVTTDRDLAASAPPFEDVSGPVIPGQRGARPKGGKQVLPRSLEEIFAHQEELRRNPPDHARVDA